MGHFHGVFYEIPRAADDKHAPDFQRMRPVTTHRQPITDYCTWRGLLVLTGGAAVPGAGKTITSTDRKVSLWFGAVDDLWRFGKPVGEGGPWKDTVLKANEPSDPYLMTGYDRKTLTLSHTSSSPVRMRVEVDLSGTGRFVEYGAFEVPPGKPIVHEFPEGFQAYWLRVKAEVAATATAWLKYE